MVWHLITYVMVLTWLPMCMIIIITVRYCYVIMGAMASHITTSRLFTQPFIQAQIKESIKAPRHWPLCGNSLVTGEFPAQMARNAENVSIWWRHHVLEVQKIGTYMYQIVTKNFANAVLHIKKVHTGMTYPTK